MVERRARSDAPPSGAPVSSAVSTACEVTQTTADLDRHRRIAATIFAMSALCRGSPANAPSRSTTCSRSAPSSHQLEATATGSSENTVSRSLRP